AVGGDPEGARRPQAGAGGDRRGDPHLLPASSGGLQGAEFGRIPGKPPQDGLRQDHEARAARVLLARVREACPLSAPRPGSPTSTATGAPAWWTWAENARRAARPWPGARSRWRPGRSG